MSSQKSSVPAQMDLERLQQRKIQLEDELKAVKQALREVHKAEPASPESVGRHRSRPVRAAVLDALDEFGCPAYSRALALYLKARYGRDIPSTRFGSLSKDEQAAVQSRSPRSVFLCHGLTSERFEAIKRLWGRSDWPLWRRIVAPTTGRVQHLEMTQRLCELALTVKDSAVDPESMRIIAADHARDLPGISFKRGVFELELWRDVARAELEKWSAQDQALREAAAARLQQLGDEQQLFGVPETMLSTVPSSQAYTEGETP